MAIKVSFSGSSIRKPGSYSRSTVDNTRGRQLSDNGTILLIGESSTGAPGDVEGIQSFTASQLPDLISKYGSGPLVDCAKAAVQAPSNSPNIAGADQVLVWKTNSSTQASLTLQNGNAEDIIVLKDRAWGAAGNQIAVTIAAGSTANQKTITISKNNDTEALGENSAVAQLSLEYTGAGSVCALSISAGKVLTTTCTGAPGDDLSVNLSDFTVAELANFLNNQTNYTAVLLNTQSGSVRQATDLDKVDVADILNSASSLYRLQKEIVELINQNSELVEASLASPQNEGVPANITSESMTGGAKGASVNSDFSTGLSKSLGEVYEVAVPCISQDATADILLGQTDSGSTYTIASVLAALSSHLILRGNTKNRREAQGFAGFRSTTKATWYAQAQSLASFRVQLAGQDVLFLGVDGNLSWKQPHVMAALMAGARLGSDVGEPLTYKYINIAGAGHAVNPETGIEAGDFDPIVDVDTAIDAGVTFVERPSSGGFRVVVDNTTYGADENFVFNRGSVIEAADFVAKTLRQQTEAVFIGTKISNGQAASIKTFIRSLLLQLNDPSNQIITSSDDAPNGFKEESFVVTINGNTARVQVEIKPVQGLDFILLDLTLGDISQSA